jgi:hypothetical protein
LFATGQLQNGDPSFQWLQVFEAIVNPNYDVTITVGDDGEVTVDQAGIPILRFLVHVLPIWLGDDALEDAIEDALADRPPKKPPKPRPGGAVALTVPDKGPLTLGDARRPSFDPATSGLEAVEEVAEAEPFDGALFIKETVLDDDYSEEGLESGGWMAVNIGLAVTAVGAAWAWLDELGDAARKPAARVDDITPGKCSRPGAAMRLDDAIDEVRHGGDALADCRDNARRIAEAAGDGPPVWDPPHGPGQRPHFHPTIGGERAPGHVSY